jgi:hypothetical protein
MGEPAAFKAAGLPFITTANLLLLTACTKLDRPLSAATPEALLAALRTRGEMLLSATTGEVRRSLEQGPRSLEDVSAALEAHLVALETTPPAIQLILDELDRKSAEVQQKRPNSPMTEDDASPSKKLRGLALGLTETKEQRGASEERPNGDSGEPPATAAKLRAAATAAAATAAAAKAQKPPHRASSRPAVAALIVPASPTSPVPIAPADSTADSTATTTAVESAAQTAAALATAPHPDV